MAGDDTRTPQPPGPRDGQRFRRRDIFLTIAIVVVIVGAFYGFSFARGGGEGAFVEGGPLGGALPSGPAPRVGSPAPDFQVSLLNGGTFRLSEHRGHMVWINFWATWCPPCRVEMPDIQSVWEDEGGSDLMLVAVDYAESRTKVQEFVDRLNLTFPIGMDYSGAISAQYRIAGFPSHFLVDRDGILREIRVGLMSEDTMRSKLKELRSY